MRRVFGKAIPSGYFVTIIVVLAVPAIAQDKKEATFKVAPRPIVSITNNYGPITVTGSGDQQVVVTSESRSASVKFENEQHGNRIQLRVVSSTPGDNLAEYMVVVPSDAWVTVRSSGAPTRAEKLRGDVYIEAVTGPVTVSEMHDAHIHLRSLEAPITLTRIHSCQIDVNSLSGDVILRDVTESLTSVHAGGGRILFEGDPGTNGDYDLTSNTGDLDVSIPAKAVVDIKPRSLQGDLSAEALTNPSGEGGQHFVPKSKLSAASVFVLRSFRGKIHVKRP